MRSLIPLRRPAEPAPGRRDPAPSRAAYRMQRLWLTPLFRALMRVGLPAFVLALAAGVYLADDGRRAAIGQGWADLRASVEERPEFMVTLMAVDGASPALADAVREMAGVTLPQSSFTLDLPAIRARIATLDAVAGVELRVRSGGVLQVTVTERVPVAIWRTPEGLNLLDEGGKRVAMILARADRADLPVLAGEGANAAVPEALALVAAAGPLTQRVRGLVRMGKRRWDIVLDRDQRILLPVAEPVRALERLLALDKAEGLLARDLTAIDLRIQSRPTLRLAPDALTSLRRAQGIIPPEESEL